MTWEDVLTKARGSVGQTINCENERELLALRDIIKAEIPSLRTPQIEDALEACCREVEAPRERDEFLACLRQRLF